jgi:two-component system, sensor histidine kinase and response regulator
VHSSCEALIHIGNDILDLSKVEAGKLFLEELDFDLRRLISERNEVLSLCSRSDGLSHAGNRWLPGHRRDQVA